MEAGLSTQTKSEGGYTILDTQSDMRHGRTGLKQRVIRVVPSDWTRPASWGSKFTRTRAHVPEPASCARRRAMRCSCCKEHRSARGFKSLKKAIADQVQCYRLRLSGRLCSEVVSEPRLRLPQDRKMQREALTIVSPTHNCTQPGWRTSVVAWRSSANGQRRSTQKPSIRPACSASLCVHCLHTCTSSNYKLAEQVSSSFRHRRLDARASSNDGLAPCGGRCAVVSARRPQQSTKGAPRVAASEGPLCVQLGAVCSVSRTGAARGGTRIRFCSGRALAEVRVSMENVERALDGHGRYERVKDLGSGTFGAVQLCKDKQTADTYVAVKLIPRGPKTVTEYVISEIRNFRCAQSFFAQRVRECRAQSATVALAFASRPCANTHPDAAARSLPAIQAAHLALAPVRSTPPRARSTNKLGVGFYG